MNERLSARSWPAYLALILWVAAFAAAASLFAKLPSTATGYRDFSAYYVPSLAVRRGINPYNGDFESVYTEVGRPIGDIDMGTNHLGDTPAWFLFFMPLTFLSTEQAYWTWQTLNMLALGGALFLLIDELGPRGTEVWATAALMVLYPPIAISIWFGRGEMILLFLLSWVWLRYGAGVMQQRARSWQLRRCCVRTRWACSGI